MSHNENGRTPEERFWNRVIKTDGCWQWLGTRTANGYGVVRIGGRSFLVHGVAYRWLVGAVASGLQLDHLCRNRLCVNPVHLEPVKQRENILRGLSPAAQHARATHCPSGHPYVPANTYRYPTGTRQCRTCRRVYQRARYWAVERARRRLAKAA